MWVFVYGLMIYLPACSRPADRVLARRTGGITLWR